MDEALEAGRSQRHAKPAEKLREAREGAIARDGLVEGLEVMIEAEDAPDLRDQPSVIRGFHPAFQHPWPHSGGGFRAQTDEHGPVVQA